MSTYLAQNSQMHEAKLEGELDKSTIISEYFNNALSVLMEKVDGISVRIQKT